MRFFNGRMTLAEMLIKTNQTQDNVHRPFLKNVKPLIMEKKTFNGTIFHFQPSPFRVENASRSKRFENGDNGFIEKWNKGDEKQAAVYYQPRLFGPYCKLRILVFFFIDEKYSVRNLQEGPKTRLIRGIYIIYQKKKGNLVLILTTYLQRKK